MRVLFRHYDPEYTTHLNNYGHNNHNGMKNIIHFCNTDTIYKSYWCVNSMTINDLQKICIGFVDHNMSRGYSGPMVVA